MDADCNDSGLPVDTLWGKQLAGKHQHFIAVLFFVLCVAVAVEKQSLSRRAGLGGNRGRASGGTGQTFEKKGGKKTEKGRESSAKSGQANGKGRSTVSAGGRGAVLRKEKIPAK